MEDENKKEMPKKVKNAKGDGRLSENQMLN